MSDLRKLADELNYAEKVERSTLLIEEAIKEYGDSFVVAHSLGKDSSVLWHLAGSVDSRVRGFIVTTSYKPQETKDFMQDELTLANWFYDPVVDSFRVDDDPRLIAFETDEEPDHLYRTDPDACCEKWKVDPVRAAIKKMKIKCWATGLRCTEGRTRTNYLEREHLDEGLEKLNPILLWHEREIWQYLALNSVPVNPLYNKGYRSLGCEPCSRISASGDERAGRWVGTSKCGGECGIHTRPLGTK